MTDPSSSDSPNSNDPPPVVSGPDGVEAAVDALGRGLVVGIPTDTVYGLAVDPFQPGASGRIFAAKGRPRTATLPVLVAGVDQAIELAAELTPVARTLMAKWWPGPLTIVVTRGAGIGVDLGDEVDTIGLRCPDHPVPLALAGRVGPIATTSANRHGQPPITTAVELAATLPGIALVVDAGVCDGTPSTVVDCRGDDVRVMRAGHIDRDLLVASLGR